MGNTENEPKGRWTPDNLEVTDEDLARLRGEASKYLQDYNTTESGEVVDTHDYDSEDRLHRERTTRNPTAPRRINRTYPWKTWMDGQIHMVMRGEHFDMATPQFQQFLHNKARMKDMVVWTRTSGDVVEFGFFKSPEERYDAIHRLTVL